MSSNTKIVVLKSKELIYTGIFVVLGILLILLLFYMFSPDKNAADKNTTESKNEEVVTTYSPGVYTSNLNLGGSSLLLSVTVDETNISHVDITNLDETISAMYPLLTPSLEEINAQISNASSIDDITYSDESKYTTIIILEAIKEAISPAICSN